MRDHYDWEKDRDRGHGRMDWDRRPEARRYGNEPRRPDWDRERRWTEPESHDWDRSREEWSRDRDEPRRDWRDWNRTPEGWSTGADPGTRPDWWHDATPRGRNERQRIAEYGGGDFGNQGIWGSQANRTDPGRSSEWNWSQSWGGNGRSDTGHSQRRGFAGRGPKGWSRSDNRIREDINERLTEHPYIDASDIEVQVSQSEVTLTGTVEDRQAKRLAEDIAEGVSGVKEIHNQLRLQPRHETADR